MTGRPHCMVDLETLGTARNAAILTIGAVKYHPAGGPMGETFYRRVDYNTCAQIGMVIEKQTVEWWMKQSEAAKKEAFDPAGRLPVLQVMQEFASWYTGCEKVWSHGKEFDIEIITDCLKRLGMRTPWHYSDPLDTRTLFYLAGVSYKGTKHNALQDAIEQAQAVQQAYAILAGRFAPAGTPAQQLAAAASTVPNVPAQGASQSTICARY